MKKLKFLTIWLLVAFLTNCGQNPSNPNPKAETQEFKINGMNASDFYAQFYEVDSKEYCTSNEPFKYYIFVDNLKLKTVDQNESIYGNIVIHIFSNKTYDFEYSEYQGESLSRNHEIYSTKFSEKTWSIDDQGNIIFEGLGIGSGLSYNGNPAISLTVNTFFSTPELKNSKSFLLRSKTSSTEEERTNYCEKNGIPVTENEAKKAETEEFLKSFIYEQRKYCSSEITYEKVVMLNSDFKYIYGLTKNKMAIPNFFTISIFSDYKFVITNYRDEIQSNTPLESIIGTLKVLSSGEIRFGNLIRGFKSYDARNKPTLTLKFSESFPNSEIRNSVAIFSPNNNIISKDKIDSKYFKEQCAEH